MQLLKVKQAAAKLAVSTWTIRRLVHDGHLYGMRIRGGLRIDADSIRRYVDDQGEKYSLQHGICFANMSRDIQA